MKFLYLVPDLGITVCGEKGASSHIRGFVGALKNLGNKVAVLTTAQVSKVSLDVPIRVIPPPSLIEGILPDPQPRTFRALRHLFYNTAIEQTLLEMIKEELPDCIYERYSPFSFAGGAFAKKHGIPHVLEVNAPLAEQGKLYRKQALQDAAEVTELSAFSNTGYIITLTHQLKDWLISLGISPEKIGVRPCGVDENLFCPEGVDFKTGFSQKIVLGFVGSLKPWHDIEMLGHVFPMLADDPRFHLLIVGDGPLRDAVNQIASDFPGRVTLTGAIPQAEVPAYIRTMDIALSPYPNLDLFYFSPLKLYEYMAMGKAIIATDIGQIGEVIKNGVNGMLVPPGDTKGWVQAIRALADDSSFRIRLGQKAREEILLEHTWEKRAKAFMELLDASLVTP